MIDPGPPGDSAGSPAGPDAVPLDELPGADGPWAMQLAVRYDKAALPTHAAVCAAAARAVVTLLADERARSEGEWAAAVRRWRDGRIRKLVRRARGIRWDRCHELPGVTVDQDGADVRAFVPLPARPLPPALDELQVSGTEFPRSTDAEPATTPDGTGNAPRPVVTVALRPGLALTTGKAAAQCAHAAQLAWEHLVLAGESTLLRAWSEDDWRVGIVDDATPAQWADLADAPIHVVDAGFTEVDGPTETTRAWW